MARLKNDYIEKYAHEMEDLKVQCNCGTKTIIPAFVDRRICRGCGNYVYKDDKLKFKYKLLETIKRKEKRTVNMIDTAEAGAGSYPSAPENEEKCFYFVIDTSNQMAGYIYARSVEEAEKRLESGKYDELIGNKIIQVEEVGTLIEVDK